MICKWRWVIAEHHRLSFVKQEAMQLAGGVPATPRLEAMSSRDSAALGVKGNRPIGA
jgi:hypothetical protein